MFFWECILYFFVLVPYIKLYDFGTDLQPWALIIGIATSILYLIRNKGLICLTKLQTAVYAISILGVLIVLCFSTSLYSGLRDALAYFTIIFVSFSGYNMFKRNEGINEKEIKIVIWLYFFVALIQKYIYSDFLYFIIANHRTSSNRGVPSLTAEPSFYGYMCVFFLFFAYDFKKYKYQYILLLLLQIILFANSTVTLMYLLIIGIMYLLVNIQFLKWKRVCQLILGASIGSVMLFKYINSINSSNRMVYLIKFFLTSDLKKSFYYFYNHDVSIKTRVNDILECFMTFLNKYGLPQGGTTRRISSGYGSLLLELGIFGAICIVLIALIFYKGYSKSEGLVIAVSISCIMFSSVQLATPIFSLFIGYCLYRSEVKENIINQNKKILGEAVNESSNYYSA